MCKIRKPTRDITVNIFSARFFKFPQVFFISASFFIFPQVFFLFPQGFLLFPQGLLISARFCSFPQGLFNFRKVILFPQGLFYFRKVIFLNLALANANLSTILFEARHYAKWPGPTSTLVVTIENIFAEIKITLRK